MAYTSSYTGPQIDEKLGLAHKQGQVAAGSGITVTKTTTEGVVTSTVAIDATTIPTKTEVTTEITNAVNALDVASVGGDTKYISAISETNGKISATAKDFPTIPSKVSDLTNDSAFQTESQVSTAITTEINKLDVTDTAVTGKYVSAVSESDGKISVTRANLPTVPTKTSDLTNDSDFITSADVPTKVSELTNDAGYLTEHQSLANYTTKTYVDTEVGKKQDKLTAGTNITIGTDGKTISATDTTYTAGTNVQISAGNVISATDTTYTAGAGISITGNVISSVASAPQFSEILGNPTDNAKLSTALAAKADASTVYTKTESDSKFRTETQVSTAITTEIAKLDKADTAVSGKYVSAVSEVDGVITVTRADLPSSVDAYTKAEADAKIATEIQKLDKADTAVAGKYVSQVSETDGVITVTRADLPTYTGNSEKFIEVDSSNKIGVTDAFIEGLGEIGTAISDLQEEVTNLESSVVYPENIKDYIKAGDGIRLSTPTGTNDVVVSGYTVTPAGGSDIQVNYNTSLQEIQISATSFPEVHADYTDLLTIEHKTGSSTTPVISAPGLATKAEIPTKTSDLTNDSDLQNSTQVSSAITSAINGLNKSGSPSTNQYISIVRQSAGIIECQKATLPMHTAGNGISVSSGTVSAKLGSGLSFDANGAIQATGTGSAAWGSITGTLSSQTDLKSALDDKQDKLTAGTNITISGSTISAADTTYTGTDGQISISASNQIGLASEFTAHLAELETAVVGKQDALTAGTNITIESNTVSAPLAVTTCAATATAESQVLKIVRVTELPADPDPTTLYVVIE